MNDEEILGDKKVSINPLRIEKVVSL